ncbi:hypothetical protein PDESU_02420 [Pontiella desulfatans]|uniref:Hydrazine synthase alpha subunit middle domain-containing protein n=1 Tax=Pontiella desulfatans TaxID=2750659 RepID=A0A6C2U1U8_PONDE|nr:PD40 domain-containing protein [Pontiella desulfatans]VGO13863.1 hypothetical protein PDESU_02420 [Pontiella desulfatans]
MKTRMIALGVLVVALGASAAKKRPEIPVPEMKADRAAVCAAIEDLMATFGQAYPDGRNYLKQLERADEAQLEAIQREALLANPLVREAQLLYVVRRQYKADHHNTATLFQKGEINEAKFDPPGKIKVLNLKTGTTATLVDAGATGIARDPELSHDGRKVIFSMRKSKDDDYHIYETNIDGSGLRQLTSLAGVSDIDPVYLPDGKIIFSSSREPKFCMCNRHIMANLYRMDGDGANIHQIGKSTLFEGHSTVMADGRILYDRWEYVDRNFGDAQGLWVVNPDGTMHAIFYGNNTPSPGGVIDARQIPGTQNVISIFGSCHDRPWGALAILDRNKGVDGAAAVEHIWPASARELIGVGNFDTFKKVRPRYEDPFPLAEPETLAGAGKYFLCARTIQGNDERTGIYLIDTFGNEVLVHEEADGFGCYDPMPIRPRKSENAKPDQRDFENRNGTFYVQDVYEGTHMEGVERGEVKWLRVVTTPEKRSWTQQRWGGQGTQAPAMNWHSFESKGILGTVPVEADGSAYFEVPSDTFVYFQLLDKDGKMIQSMRSGTMIQSGEMQGCVGCHEDRVETPPASALGLQALKRPASPMGKGYAAGRMFNYLADAQPVFDKHCVKCHDYGKKGAEAVILAGDKGLAFNASYTDLHRKKLVAVAGGGQAEIYPAKAWGTYASKLSKTLNGHGKAKLSDAEKLSLYTWMDLNGIYYPTYDCAYPDHPTGRSPITVKQLNRLAELCGLDVKALTSHRNHPGTMVSFDRPEISPCLSALEKGSDEYKEALAIIEEGENALRQTPRADMPGFVASENDRHRTERYEQYRSVEAAYREALRKDRKLYDADVQRLIEN